MLFFLEFLALIFHWETGAHPACLLKIPEWRLLFHFFLLLNAEFFEDIRGMVSLYMPVADTKVHLL